MSLGYRRVDFIEPLVLLLSDIIYACIWGLKPLSGDVPREPFHLCSEANRRGVVTLLQVSATDPAAILPHGLSK